jgi:spore germination protein (amino acid permease)
MYSTNKHISGRQLHRLIVVDFLGLLALLMPQTALYLSSQDGLIAIFYAGIFSMVYTFLILLLKSKIKINLIDFVKEKAGKFCSVIVGLIFAIKYFILAVIVLYILGDIVNKILLPEINPIVIVGAMLIVATLCVAKGLESRARMAEILYYIVLIPILIILIFSFKHVDKYNITPLLIQSQAQIIKSAFILAFLFSPSEMLLFGDDYFTNDKKTRRSIYYGIITVGIINLFIFAVNVGIFGVNGMSGEDWPTITLMQVVEVTGMFFERQDGIMSIFCIVGLFASVSAMIYYIVYILKKMFNTRSTRRYGWISVLLLFIAVSILMSGNYAWNMKSRQTAKVEIENKAYVMALGIDKLNNELSVTYTFASIASQTGQSSKEEDKETFNCNVENIYDAANIFSRQSDKKLDFNHLKVIVLGSDLLKDKDYLDEVITYLKSDSQFARGTNVCVSMDTANNILSLDKNMSTSIGNYLQKMFITNLIGYSSTAQDLIENQSDNKIVEIIPVLTVQDKYPVMIESVIMKGLNVVKYCDLDETMYFSIIKGQGEGSLIDLSSGAYQIEYNDVISDIEIISGRTIHLKLTYSGKLNKRDITDNTAVEEDINEELEKIILDKITELREKYNIDYMETQKMLGIYDKKLWKKYENDEEGLFKNLYVEVKCNFTVK